MDTSKKKTEIVIDTPKSAKGTRNIPLNSFLLAELKKYRAERENEKIISNEIYDNRGFIICNEIGGPVEPKVMQDVFKRLLVEADIKDANFHCLRHSFATRAVEINMDIKTLSEILGHADVSTTLNRYAHSLDEQKRKAMSMMETLFI